MTFSSKVLKTYQIQAGPVVQEKQVEMKFRHHLLKTYSFETVAYTPNFGESFELDSEIAKFLTEYSLWDDVEAVATAKILTDKERQQQNNALINKPAGKVSKLPSADNPPPPKTKEFMKYPLGTELKLKADVQSELGRTYKLFMDNSHAKNRMKQTEMAITEDINKIIKKVSSQLKVQPKGIQVSVSIDEPSNYSGGAFAGYITIKYKGEDLDLEPSGLYLQMDSDVGDDAKEWNWVAWLGIHESPFHSDSWTDSYHFDRASSWFAEAGNIKGDKQQIEDKVKHLLLDYENADQEAAKDHYMGQRRRHEQWKKQQEKRKLG